MPKALPPITESADELRTRLQAEKNSHRRSRLQLLIGIESAQFQTRQQAAVLLGKSRHTIRTWLQVYQQHGLDALLAISYRGAQPGQRSIPQPAYEAMAEQLNSTTGFATYMVLQGWLLAEHDVEINYETLRAIVRRDFGGKLKVARPSHQKKRGRGSGFSRRLAPICGPGSGRYPGPGTPLCPG